MMESIKSFFQHNMAETAEDEAETQPAELRLAACALLLELAYADDEFTERLDHIAGRIGTGMAFEQHDTRGCHIQGQAQQGRHQDDRRKHRKLHRLE